MAHLTAADFKHVRELVRHMRTAGRRHASNDLVALDLEFHSVINTRSEHRLLLELLASVGMYTRGFIAHNRSYDARLRNLQFVANSHTLLLEALLTREPDRAEQAVHAHIQRALASLSVASASAAAHP